MTRVAFALALFLAASTAMAAGGEQTGRDQNNPYPYQDGAPCYNDSGQEGTWYGDRCYMDGEQ